MPQVYGCLNTLDKHIKALQKPFSNRKILQLKKYSQARHSKQKNKAT